MRTEHQEKEVARLADQGFTHVQDEENGDVIVASLGYPFERGGKTYRLASAWRILPNGECLDVFASPKATSPIINSPTSWPKTHTAASAQTPDENPEPERGARPSRALCR